VDKSLKTKSRTPLMQEGRNEVENADDFVAEGPAAWELGKIPLEVSKFATDSATALIVGVRIASRSEESKRLTVDELAA